MDATGFIKDFLKSDTTLVAQQVYDIFVREHNGDCTYPYFRTLYNNERNRYLRNMTSAPVNVPAQPQVLKEIEVEPIELTIVNYSEEENITLENEVIPTGTVWDEYICEPVIQEVALEENEPVVEEKHYAGFVRKCVDVTAGKPGEKI